MIRSSDQVRDIWQPHRQGYMNGARVVPADLRGGHQVPITAVTALRWQLLAANLAYHIRISSLAGGNTMIIQQSHPHYHHREAAPKQTT